MIVHRSVLDKKRITMQIDGVDTLVEIPAYYFEGRRLSDWVKATTIVEGLRISEHDIPIGLFTDEGMGSVYTGGHTYRFKGKINNKSQ